MKPSASITLKGLVRRAFTPLIISIILSGLASVLLIVQMGLLASIITDIAFHHHMMMAELPFVITLIICVITRSLCQASADTLGDYAGQKITASLRLEILQHLFRVGPVGLSGQETGHITTALSEGVDALRPYIARYMTRAAAMIVTPLLILAVVLNLDWWSFLILAITGPLIPIFMALVGYSAQKIMNQKWTELLLLGSSFLDMLQGLTTLRLFGRTRESITLVTYMANNHRRSTMAVMRVAFLTSAVLEFFASLSIALVAVVFGARLLNTTITFQNAFFVLLLAPEFFMPLRNFSASYHARQNANSAFEAITKLLILPEMRHDNEAASTFPNSSPKTLVIEKLRAGYGKNHDVLCEISAQFKRNQITLITGESGSGKTTLMRILLEMMPPRSGQCYIVMDDNTSHPLHNMRMGWVPQHPFLFARSIADNLRLSSPEASHISLRKACEEAGLTQVIEDLPQGIETILGERGAPLSAGQIRRLALARALLCAPHILLFDEPTADLDLQNASLVADSIARTKKDRICIVIAHRTEIARHADVILHIQNGKYVFKEGGVQ